MVKAPVLGRLKTKPRTSASSTGRFKSSMQFGDIRISLSRSIAPRASAAVVGDTIGDPFKDTAGPSLHVLVKLLSTITLVLAPIFI